jgi:CheY-like chemotaxis protein
VKFTEDGVIVLRVALCPPGGPCMRFEISDTGRGIEESLISGLFQPFTQLDPRGGGASEGSGLGLVISRKIARLLGGDLWLVRSEPGVGSTFAVEIASGVDATSEAFAPPVLATEPQWAITECDIEFLKGRRVLVVDDSADSRGLISRFLSGAGVEVDVAENGFDGVDRALGGKSYDLILMDLQMPKLDGFGALRKLRSRGYGGPVAALTARALREERDRCLASGFDAHLAKPIRSRDLLRTVSDICRREEAMAAYRAPSRM